MSHAGALIVVIVLSVYLSSVRGLPARRISVALAILVSAAVAGAVLSAPSFRPTAGLRYPGVGVGVVLALPLVQRLLPSSMSLLAFGDLIAAPLAFEMGIAKVGCFFHGCCHGSPSQLPWAFAFPHHGIAWFHQFESGQIPVTAVQSLPVHPLQLYFAAWSMCIGVLLLWVGRHMVHDGQVLLLLVALLMAGWFVVENVKVPPDLPLRVVALLVSLIATGVLLAQMVRGRGAAGGSSQPPGAERPI